MVAENPLSTVVADFERFFDISGGDLYFCDRK